MTTNEALLALVEEAVYDRNTKRGYRTACKALDALQAPPDLRAAILYRMSYTDQRGEPYKWFTEKSRG